MRMRRIVQVMHKRIDSALAVGHRFTFRSGDAYEVQPNGSVLRVEKKRWRNKAEMKAFHRARRDELWPRN